MTLGLDDMLYTKEVTLATFKNLIIPRQELTLEGNLSESRVSGESSVKNKTMKELDPSCEGQIKLTDNNNETIDTEVRNK